MTCVLLAPSKAGLTYPRSCNSACYDAGGPAGECQCICGGMNHGVGLSKAVKNTKEEYPEYQLNGPLPVILRADQVPPEE